MKTRCRSIDVAEIRHLQRALLPRVVVALLVGAPLCAIGATLPVTTCADDGSPGTLRSVIGSAANGDVVDLTGLACSTITLTEGAIDATNLGVNPLRNLTIQGPGSGALTISGDHASDVLRFGDIYNNFENVLTINDLTIAHGEKYNGPGCVYGLKASIYLNHTTVTDCRSMLVGSNHFGGAVLAQGLYMSTSTISNSSTTVLSGNTVTQGGGAWSGADAILVDSAISGNSVIALFGKDSYGKYTAGGGLYVALDATLVDSTVAGNSATATNPGEHALGGGLFVGGSVTIINSTISGNRVDGDGGALFKPIAAYYTDQTTVVAQDSTITGNVASGTGGAFTIQRPATLLNSTIAFNRSGLGGAVMFQLAGIDYTPPTSTLEIESTILAGNTRLGSHPPPYAADLATDGTLAVTGANNLIGFADAPIALPPDTIHGDPQLSPLAWNGGPTQTLALDSGSPAIDAGNNAANLATDQRGGGYVRVYGPAADIGAYEVQPTPDVIFANGFDP